MKIMNKRQLLKLFLVMQIFLINKFIFADGIASTPFPLEDINTGARAVGFAGAFTAISDDATSIYYNPAGLANLKKIEIDAAYYKWFMDTFLSYACFNVPIGSGSIGGMFLYTSYGKFDLIDEKGIFLNTSVEPLNLKGAIGYGFPLGSIFSFGLGLKLNSFIIEDYNKTSFLLDLGLRTNINDFIFLGLAVQNIGFEENNLNNIKAGLGINIFNIQGNKWSFEFDTKYSMIYGLSYSLGTELQLFKLLALRGGYNIDKSNDILGNLSGVSFGAGITIEKLSVDYAFSMRGDLGTTHLIGLKFFYETAEEKEKSTYRKLTEFLAYQDFKDGEDAFNAGNYKKALAIWEEVKAMMPDFEGIDEAILKVKNIIKAGGKLENIDKLFNEGMAYYEKFDFDNAVKKWSQVKKLMPNYKDIDVWLKDANDLKKGGKMSRDAEKYFREGLKYYNNCDYIKAIASWQKGLEKDPNNKKINQYIERAKVKQQEISNGILKAKADIANDATVIEGIKNLRQISNVCPAYNDAIEILATLKGLINAKTKEYYLKGIEKYTEGNLEAAILYWNNIEKLDPKSEYIYKVRRYITDARNKQKAVLGIEKRNKK